MSGCSTLSPGSCFGGTSRSDLKLTDFGKSAATPMACRDRSCLMTPRCRRNLPSPARRQVRSTAVSAARGHVRCNVAVDALPVRMRASPSRRRTRSAARRKMRRATPKSGPCTIWLPDLDSNQGPADYPSAMRPDASDRSGLTGPLTSADWTTASKG
jgi:hypothetical protein